MRITSLLSLLGALGLAAWGPTPSAAAAGDESKGEPIATRSLIDESVNQFQLLPDANSREPLQPQVVLRWQNPTRGREGDAALVLWNRGGHPEAFASLFTWEGNFCHELGSLSREARLTAVERDGGRVVWAPAVPGVTFRDVPDAPTPADSAPGRLLQMRTIAARFKAVMTGWRPDNSDREELRLLPRPLYRYELAGPKSAPPDVLDGALFAFVQGTDPEVVMPIEAVRREGRPRWQYAFARATSGGLEARLGNAVVWTAEKFPSDSDPSRPQITVRRPVEP